jgi:tRNA U34 5-methylaminomethyl-2-thiouridine-forming methyltransferase MnmC
MKTNQFFSLDCGSPPGHKKTPTNDGTFTLESERFTENCHSTAGAYEETLFNYINGTELKNKLSLPSLNVFEVGFGLGIGPLATFQELNNYPGELNYYSSELDENLIHWFKSSVSDHAISLFPFDQLMPFTYRNGLKSFKAKNGNRTLEIFIGDLTKIDKDIENILGNIHAIYQDPFSPKKNPELWSQSWFETLKKISHPEVILSTYSASHSVHDNLSRSGWHVTRAPGFAHKRSSTRATLKEDIYQGPIK